jgi:titin
LKGLENISGFEEQEVTLEVEVDKDHWKKNGTPIDGQWLRGPRELRPSYKYHMSNNENLYALTIKDLMFEDEGDYTFKIEGHETRCRLKIDEAPVVFTKPLSRVSAKEKDDVTLECEANKIKWKITGKDIDFTWKKGDGRLDETSKVKFEKQGRKLMLNLKKISLNDASEYSCNAGEGALASKTIGGLEVQELPLGFDEGLKDIEKQEGETAILEAVINRPGADVIWFKDGKKIDFSDPRFEQKVDKEGRIQLIIKPCVLDDEATYEAKVGTKKTQGKLRVKEGPAFFITPLADMSVKEGAPAILHAEVNKMRYQQTGSTVNITWYRNDIPISKYDDRVEVKTDDCHLYCTVKKIAMDDSGAKYSVSADTARTEGVLTVTEEPLYFVEKMKDTPLKKIPSTVTLSCKLNKPGVPVQWLKDGMPIRIDGDKYEVKEENGKHFLIINDCTGEDEGKYTCKAKDVVCDCKIEVQAAPWLDIPDETRTIKAGTGTVFEIPYSGHPVPTVAWTHKGAALDNKRRRAEHVPGKQLKLIVKESVRADSGAYTVVLENDHGKTDGFVKLNVLDIPGPPRNLGFREVFSDRIVVE